MQLPVPLSLRPMEAEAVDALPRGPDWRYEPKYDGFRCLAFRDGHEIRLQSRNQKPLDRYFPEIVSGLMQLPARRFVLDGEITVGKQPFEVLQRRLCPASARIDLLAVEHPADYVAFDLLADAEARSLLERPFAERRGALEQMVGPRPRKAILRLSRITQSAGTARRWLGKAGFDGIMAKRIDLAYRPGRRDMRKFKLMRTVDCVIAGLYLAPRSHAVEHFLLGLYDGDGKLHYVGHAPVGHDALEIGRALQPLIGGAGFTGRAPVERNRWSGKERKPVPLRPVLVAEVGADQIAAGFMRHGAKLLRWRDDKPPEACTLDQIQS